MRVTTKGNFNKSNTNYKNVTSPTTNGTAVQVTDLEVDDGTLKYSIDGGANFVDPESALKQQVALKTNTADLLDGTVKPLNATNADNADYATTAGNATTADTATNANHATSADTASSATTADTATTAGSATNATNADNAIKNSDNTYSGLTQDANNVLKVESEIISKKTLLWSGTPATMIDLAGLTEGTVLEIELKLVGGYSNGNEFKKIVLSSGNTLVYDNKVVWTSTSGFETVNCNVYYYPSVEHNNLIIANTNLPHTTYSISGGSATEDNSMYYQIVKVYKVIE